MKLITSASELSETSEAINAVLLDLHSSLQGDRPSMILVSYTEHHDPGTLRERLADNLPGATLLGSSTCRGVLTDKGLYGFEKPGLAVLAICDQDGSYGAAAEPYVDCVTACVTAAIERAQAGADRHGEVPELVWLHASPGLEEGAIAAIQATLGDGVVIAGGSSADESIGGKWSQFDGNSQTTSGVALGLFYPEAPATHHFRNGYLPTEHRGRVTRASGRCLAEIDGRPAAEIYNRWTDGLIGASIEDRSISILGTSSWHPIGREVTAVGAEVPVQCYCLLHPDSVGPDGELNLFADAPEGSVLTLMHSGPTELIHRAADVAKSSLERVPTNADPKGAIMVFCAGCMLALGEDIKTAANEITHAYDGIPFLCMFTFGEQGSFANGLSQHGNLMISSTLINA